ncbi:kelch repeat protein [Diplodia corticola]|uniref:Kelch repeat protein n=1 Tax=Diplodia corticola TaxID=236234 RepID=A0A1J9QVX3_9PEZI|nr:kelch repeat protein [Diplodia corticola]OJD33142.1 kelch repeat protein [Diplodia corticola]
MVCVALTWHIHFFILSIALVSAQGSYRRRAGHAVKQAVLAGDKLLVNGGLVANISGVPIYGLCTSENQTWIIGLSSSWNNQTLISVPVPRPTSFVPLEFETLWYDPNSSYVYSFGGEISQDGYIPNPYGTITIPEESIWRFSFDGTGEDGQWTEALGPTGEKSFPSDIKRPIMGASASDNQNAYYIGGAIYKWTTNDVGNMTELHNVPGLLQFDFSTQTLTNDTNAVPYFASVWTEQNQTVNLAGLMTSVPLFGSQGVFVLVGGQSNDTGKTEQWWETVTVFDPAKKSWYSQKATGEIPETKAGRVRDGSSNNHCAFGAQNDDLETFEIFVFGDFEAMPTAQTYYILSLPSFTWFASNVSSLPRRVQHTCTATHNRQMIMVGGLDPDQRNNIDPQDWDETPDPWHQGIGVFDMTALKYTDEYDANAANYVAPQMVQDHYKNTRYPMWDDPSLKDIFESTRSGNSSSSGLSGGEIAGVVVSAIFGPLLCIFIVAFLVRRKTRRSQREQRASELGERRSSHDVELVSLPTYEDATHTRRRGFGAPMYSSQNSQEQVSTPLGDPAGQDGSGCGPSTAIPQPRVPLAPEMPSQDKIRKYTGPFLAIDHDAQFYLNSVLRLYQLGVMIPSDSPPSTE